MKKEQYSVELKLDGKVWVRNVETTPKGVYFSAAYAETLFELMGLSGKVTVRNLSA